CGWRVFLWALRALIGIARRRQHLLLDLGFGESFRCCAFRLCAHRRVIGRRSAHPPPGEQNDYGETSEQREHHEPKRLSLLARRLAGGSGCDDRFVIVARIVHIPSSRIRTTDKSVLTPYRPTNRRCTCSSSNSTTSFSPAATHARSRRSCASSSGAKRARANRGHSRRRAL